LPIHTFSTPRKALTFSPRLDKGEGAGCGSFFPQPAGVHKNGKQMKGSLIALLTAGAILGAGPWFGAVPVDAADFEINPVEVALSPRTRSQLLNLRNASSETVRFQLSVFHGSRATMARLD
jgi:hypothetical protein